MAASQIQSTTASLPPADRVASLEAERQRLVEALALAERDRQLLGYEVHDGIVQDLAAAAMLLEAAGHDATFATTEAAEHHAGGLRLLREALGEARRLITGLATVAFGKQALHVGLTRLVEKFKNDHGLPVALNYQAEALALPASMHHLLLRIVHEALYNVWKHAAASEVELRVTRIGQDLELSVSDNGRGFDPARVVSGHFGLDGMDARAHVLGGELRIDSSPGHGTRVSIHIVLPPEP